MTFTPPSAQSGDFVKVADLNNHLLIITPTEFKTGIITALGEAEAIQVNVVDLDTNEEHSDVLFFNKALVSALKPNIGAQVLARIGQGTAKPGKSAPWILVDATNDSAAVAKATTYIANGLQKPTTSAPAAEKAIDANDPAIQALLAQLGGTVIS